MKVAARRLLEEQIAVVVDIERGEKNDAMWHVPQLQRTGRFNIRVIDNSKIYYLYSLYRIDGVI